MNIAINGFGRIGRAAAKIIFEKEDMEIVAINDLGDVETCAHLLKHDTCYRTWDHEVGFDETDLIIDSKRIRMFAEKDPANLPWKELEIDVVIECTGKFLTQEDCQKHIDAGAKKVVMSAPPKDDSKMFVLGVNADEYNGEDIISNASCTTNCIAPVMKVLEDKFGIEKALMTTIHSYTADQNLVDGPHKDLRRARAAAMNIVPTSTGAAKAVYKTIPALKGLFDGLAVRVPTPVVSLSDITLVTKKKDLTAEEIAQAFKDAENGVLKGILETTEEPIVSSDLIGMKASTLVDLPLIQVIAGDLVKIIAWYDNEWGYSNRLVDIAEMAGK